MKPAFISEDDFATMVKRVRGGVVEHASTAVQLAHKKEPPHGQSGKNPVPSPYKSKWEANYASKLDLEKKAGHVKQWWYEPLSIWLPGKIRYKPDFLIEHTPQPVYPTHICATPKLEIIEVKGWSRNKRDGMTRIKMASALFPCFTWRLVWWTGRGWDGQYL